MLGLTARLTSFFKKGPTVTVTFYNVKTKENVVVEERDLRKKIFSRPTSKGTQHRYAVRATVDGVNLTKFVSKETYDTLNVPVEE
jgi:hypothetical protein